MKNPSVRHEEIEMTEKLNDPERIEFRLIIIDAHSMRILTTASAAGHLLPHESIPAYTRVAEGLNEAIELRYGLRTLQLAILPGAEERSCCAVHEIIGSQEALPKSPSFAALNEIASSELAETERSLVLKIMKGEATELGRFARLGWIDELLPKIGIHQDRSSIPVIRQLNQGIDFCLLNLQDSNGRNLWLKAVGEPNTREYRLTQELARQFPEYLPKLVACIPEWNGWIAEEVAGAPLNHSNDKAQWEQALTALAFMQESSIENKACLYRAGAKEWSCARLLSLSAPFFEEAARAMRAQTSTKANPLGRRDLQRLQASVEAALLAIAHSGIPETLLHGDIGHGNIVTSPDGPVFLDWAETYIGFPFLSAEHLLADLERSQPELACERSYLRRSYAMRWRDYTSPASLVEVIALAPAVAAFAYALAAWEAHSRRPDPTCVWPLLRSMLRRTERELESTSEVAA
jgi:hypothetical protein